MGLWDDESMRGKLLCPAYHNHINIYNVLRVIIQQFPSNCLLMMLAQRINS